MYTSGHKTNTTTHIITTGEIKGVSDSLLLNKSGTTITGQIIADGRIGSTGEISGDSLKSFNGLNVVGEAIIDRNLYVSGFASIWQLICENSARFEDISVFEDRIYTRDIVLNDETLNSPSVRFRSNAEVDYEWAIKSDQFRNLEFLLQKEDLSDINQVMQLDLNGSPGSFTTTRLKFNHGFPSTGSGNFLRYYNNRIFVDTSSEVQKENITECDYDFLTAFSSFPPLKTYTYKDQTEVCLGLVAEDLETLNPEFCVYDTDKDENIYLAGVNKDKILYGLLKIIIDAKNDGKL